MQGMYNHIPETNHVSRVYSVAAVLWLQYIVQYIVHVMYVHSAQYCWFL
jgi:hypothetical protein